MNYKILVACWTFVTAAASMAGAANIADFTDYSQFNARGRVELPGRLFIPPEASSGPNTSRPLMVYLHGGGAIGADNLKQIAQTPDYMVDEAKRRGAFLYVPQATTTWASLPAIDSVMTMINRLVTERHVDANRLYATGYSNGGGGTWNLLSRNSKRFAAAVAVSGVAPAPGFAAANLLGTAIIALHARDDATVTVARSRTVVDGILAAAGESLPAYSRVLSNQYLLVANPQFPFHRQLIDEEPPGSTVNVFISRPDLDLIYFEQPNGGHEGVYGVFYSPEMYDWMFSHSLAAPEPSAAILAVGGFFGAILRARSARREPRPPTR
jgi:predicted peptidase